MTVIVETPETKIFYLPRNESFSKISFYTMLGFPVRGTQFERMLGSLFIRPIP